MTWRDTLRRVTLPDGRRLIGASFRGVPFFVQASQRTGGRRIVIHEFPFRDDPQIDDQGRRARTFPTEAYVVGDDYLEQRDALLAALEDVAGPGELVHPYHGVRRAIAGQVSVREEQAAGGIAVFSVEFQEAPAQAVTPSESADLAGEVDQDAEAAHAALEEEFTADYDVDGQPSFALRSLEAEFAALSEGLRAELAGVAATTQELALMNAELTILTARASSLVRQPGEALAEFLGAIRALVDTAAEAPRELADALVRTYAIDPQPLALAITATREQERQNQTALAAALRRILAVEAARLLPQVEYTTHEDATAARDSVADLLDEQMLEAGDTAYPALVELRASVVQAVPGDAELARIETIERPVTVSSILLAYRLYGSTELELDLVARNNPRHPGFMSGTLQVLSHG